MTKLLALNTAMNALRSQVLKETPKKEGISIVEKPKTSNRSSMRESALILLPNSSPP
jgi:hypothetical protein